MFFFSKFTFRSHEKASKVLFEIDTMILNPMVENYGKTKILLFCGVFKFLLW